MISKEQFDKLENMSDEDLWSWLIDNPSTDYTIYLDNDDTFIHFPDFPNETISFSGYVGWSDGIVTLLCDVLNLKAECV